MSFPERVYNIINEIEERLVDDFKSYRWSSYASILADKKTKLKKEAVLNWFEGIENFIACHHQKIELANIKKLMIEY